MWSGGHKFGGGQIGGGRHAPNLRLPVWRRDVTARKAGTLGASGSNPPASKDSGLLIYHASLGCLRKLIYPCNERPETNCQ